MKVGDLVAVGMPEIKTEFVSIILEICTPEEHRNKMHLFKFWNTDRLNGTLLAILR